MPDQTLQKQLERLHELILRERKCSIAVDLEALQEISIEKEELLQQLELTGETSPALHSLAKKIKQENRRNAYLFWSTLKFIRESMSFFNGKISRSSYGSGGQMVQGVNSGMVLKGRM